MAKDMSGFLKSFAGNLGNQLNPLGGKSILTPGGPMSGLGIMKQLMGGGGQDEGDSETAGMSNDIAYGGTGVGGKMGKPPSFLSQFGHNMSDQLFQRAMMGFMNGG